MFGFGDAPYVGSLPGLGVDVHNIVAVVPTADAKGYWMVGSDGGVFGFGNAPFMGSLPGDGVVVRNIVAFAAVPVASPSTAPSTAPSTLPASAPPTGTPPASTPEAPWVLALPVLASLLLLGGYALRRRRTRVEPAPITLGGILVGDVPAADTTARTAVRSDA